VRRCHPLAPVVAADAVASSRVRCAGLLSVCPSICFAVCALFVHVMVAGARRVADSSGCRCVFVPLMARECAATASARAMMTLRMCGTDQHSAKDAARRNTVDGGAGTVWWNSGGSQLSPTAASEDGARDSHVEIAGSDSIKQVVKEIRSSA